MIFPSKKEEKEEIEKEEERKSAKRTHWNQPPGLPGMILYFSSRMLPKSLMCLKVGLWKVIGSWKCCNYPWINPLMGPELNVLLGNSLVKRGQSLANSAGCISLHSVSLDPCFLVPPFYVFDVSKFSLLCLSAVLFFPWRSQPWTHNPNKQI